MLRIMYIDDIGVSIDCRSYCPALLPLLVSQSILTLGPRYRAAFAAKTKNILDTPPAVLSYYIYMG